MEIIKVAPSESKLWEQVWRLYTESFPDYERRRISSHSRASEDPYFHTEIAIDNGHLMALLFYWKKDGLIYLEHLAVHQNMRGKNVGTQLIGNFLEENKDHRIILEIDPPVDDISIKRLGFYRRLGFHLNDYHYIHPSYSKNGQGHELKVMSWPEPIDEEQFEGFKNFMAQTVMVYID